LTNINKDGKLSLRQVDNVFIIAAEKDQVVPIEPISSFYKEIEIDPLRRVFFQNAKFRSRLAFST
jgi:hypothetical protein